MDCPPTNQMTDREIAEETLNHLRGFAKAIEAIGNNPMLKGFMPPMPMAFDNTINNGTTEINAEVTD